MRKRRTLGLLLFLQLILFKRELVEPANVMSKNANMIGEKLISCANELTKVLCAELQAIRSEIVKKVKSVCYLIRKFN